MQGTESDERNESTAIFRLVQERAMHIVINPAQPVGKQEYHRPEW
jgi:hypothetical protein